jgi:hypothetical protein
MINIEHFILDNITKNYNHTLLRLYINEISNILIDFLETKLNSDIKSITNNQRVSLWYNKDIEPDEHQYIANLSTPLVLLDSNGDINVGYKSANDWKMVNIYHSATTFIVDPVKYLHIDELKFIK